MPDNRTDLFAQLKELYEAVLHHVQSWEFLLQVLAVVAALYLSRRLASATLSIPDYGSRLIQKLKANTVITFYELCKYVYLLGIFWTEQSLFATVGIEPGFVTVSLVITAIWILGRSSIALASHSAQARVVTFVLWVVILLSLFGNSTSSFEYLRKSNIRVAEFNISLMFMIEAAVIFTILLWGAQFVAELIKKQIQGATTISPSYKVLYTKISRLALFTVAAMLGLTMLGIDLTLFAVFSGAFGLGLGIGLQRVFANFISGIILLLDKSIKPGDTLEVDGTRGIVDHMNARYVSIQTSDGKNILIPNESMVTEKVHNWSFDNHRIQIKNSFAVAYGSDLDLIQNMVTDILKGYKGIIQDPGPTCLVSDFIDTGVKFDIRYWVDGSTALTNNIRHDILMATWKVLTDHGIEMAQTYPTGYAVHKKG